MTKAQLEIIYKEERKELLSLLQSEFNIKLFHTSLLQKFQKEFGVSIMSNDTNVFVVHNNKILGEFPFYTNYYKFALVKAQLLASKTVMTLPKKTIPCLKYQHILNNKLLFQTDNVSEFMGYLLTSSEQAKNSILFNLLDKNKGYICEMFSNPNE